MNNSFMSHKRRMIDGIKTAIKRGDTPIDISTSLFFKGCEFRRRGACENVVSMYLRTADIVSGMTKDGLILSLSRGDFL